MLQNNWSTLWNALNPAGDSPTGTSLAASFIDDELSVPVADILKGTVLQHHTEELRGQSVLLITNDQLSAALALIELDGIASRVVLYPPDLSLEHVDYVMRAADVDAIVSDRSKLALGNPPVDCFVRCSATVLPTDFVRGETQATEWVLLTSGTTGLPKLVLHTLASLTGALTNAPAAQGKVVWSTFYDIRRYGGLQIFLRAVVTGASLVLSSPRESVADFLARATKNRVTHISGTPSHWRKAIMSPAAKVFKPVYVRLSGEIADQAILNQLKAVFPQARISHAFASTEAGVAFDIDDGLTGFPASVLEQTPGVRMKVVNDSLQICSDRTATCYLGNNSPILKDHDGFVDTCDLVELRDGRYYFMGRRDGVINIGGQKVYPEEVEAVLNRYPDVQMSLVRTKKSPITGALVVADVVLKEVPEAAKKSAADIQNDILEFCREYLPSFKVPAAIYVVPSLQVGEAGKLSRSHA
jgi:acyl-coenzyme A synthetase/AMP-(fatty) acid ligase